jgi:hypothetical protein
MPTTSIKISQLDPIPSLSGNDFFPIDQSSSIKTYRASLTQLQNLFSTGSFTGSLIGRITGTGTSPQFVGTSSWAISSSKAISSSYADFALSSSYALSSSRSVTASYALNSNAGDLTGAGTTNYIPIWTGNKTLGNSTIYYGTPIVGYPGNISTDNIYIQKNTPILYITGSDQGSVNVYSDFNSTLTLGNAVTSSDHHSFVVTGNYGDLGDPHNRGQFNWTTTTASNNFTYVGASNPRDYSADNLSGGIIYILRVHSNGFYFWPLSSVQGASKDGTFNIGVDSGTENHDTRLKIQVFSGSSVSPTVDHLQKAIEVTYGSGSSYPVTFCVSSSGKTYIGGKLEINGGIQYRTDTNYSVISSLGDNVSVNAENYTTKFINLGNHGTASITMSRGSELNLVINQAATTPTASLYFTGSYISSSGLTFNCPIVWQGGTPPTITTGTSNRADFFKFVAVNTHNNGPKGTLGPNNTVIYAIATQNMY